MIGLRIVYAYNWTDVGPTLPAIGQAFGVGTTAWGLLLASFFAGAGILQVPAGFFARKWGNRRIALLGAALLGIAAVASATAPDYSLLVLSRFLAGAGAGLFFSPGIGLVSALHPDGARGVPVGLFSSAYNAGGGLGVFVSAILLGPLGWRATLAVGGGALLLLLLLTAWLIPRSSEGIAPPTPGPFRLPAVLRSRSVWIMGLAFIGLEGASLSASQYFVPYAEVLRGWSVAFAGAVAALLVFPSVLGGPVGGWLMERFSNRRTQLAVFTLIPGVALIALPFAGLGEVAFLAATFSFAVGMVYAMMYVAARYLPGVGHGDLPLAIGLFNGIQLAGGALVSFLVGAVVSGYGYDVAWWFLGGVIILTLVALGGLAKIDRGPDLAPASAAP
ncbi:MAG: MFS transporter [Thermoplasmata archaeon]|nr:MFS transporter [Thermoplasmata archaeon]